MARINEVQYVNFYTAGSTAFKYEPAPLPKKRQAHLPRVRRKKKILIRLDPVTALGVCLAVAMVIVMFASVGQLKAVRQQEAEMAEYVQSLQQKNTELEAQYKAGYDLEEIRQIASAMGMIPADQAQQIQVQVSTPVVEEPPTAWENFCTFLAGLFA